MLFRVATYQSRSFSWNRCHKPMLIEDVQLLGTFVPISVTFSIFLQVERAPSMLEVFKISFVVFLLGALYNLNSLRAQCASVFDVFAHTRRTFEFVRTNLIYGCNRALFGVDSSFTACQSRGLVSCFQNFYSILWFSNLFRAFPQ